MKTLDDLVVYVYKKYPLPEPYWSKAHYERRCIEIHTCEQVILKCMNAYRKDPRDIIEHYIMEMNLSRRDGATNTRVMGMINCIIATLEELWNYFD